MHGWRLRIFLVLAVYALGMVVWASRPWTDTQPLVAPDREPAFAQFRCPSVFGSGDAVRGDQLLSGVRPEGQTEDPVYPATGSPCSEQGTHRVLLVADLAAAGVGMLLLVRSHARHRAADERHSLQAVEAAGT